MANETGGPAAARDAASATWSGLVVIVPEADPLVEQRRLELDAGEPAHITLLYPFVAPDRLDSVMRARLRALFAAFPSFAYRLGAIGWFHDEVMWLAPEPAAPFVALTERLVAEFGLPPYRGEFEQITPTSR